MRHPLSKFSAVLMHAALAAAAGLASLPGHAADGAESLTYPNIIKIRDGMGARGDLAPIARIVSPLAYSQIVPGEGRIGAGSVNGTGFVLNIEVVTRDATPIAAKESLNSRNTALLVTRFGSFTDALLRLALDKWGLRPETDLPIIQMGGVPPILSGMQSKKIFGGPISLPTLAVAKQEGFRELVDLGDLIPDYQSAGVVTRKAFLRQNPEIARNFVRAMGEAIAVFKTDVAFSKKVIKDRLKIDDALVQEETQRTYLNYVPRVPYPTRAGIALIKAFLEKSEPQLKPLSVDDQIDNSFVRGLEQSGFFASFYPAK